MIRNNPVLLVILACLLAACADGTAQQEQPLAQTYDMLITGGRIVDGSGAPWYRADIAINDGKIVEIGNLSGRTAQQMIDAADRVVSPGFIDMMGGSTLPLLVDPDSALSKLHQGVTTMLVGELTTEAPHNDETFPAGLKIDGEDVKWQTYKQYFTLLEEHGIPLNAVHNIGAAQVRLVVLGNEDRPPSSAELERMKAIVAEAMEDGVFGLATSLIYPPATYASKQELVELAKVAASYDGIYLTHMRNESFRVLEALEEAIEIGTEAGLPVHIYHLKAAGQENWPLMQKALDRIAQARRDGFDVTADVYPYIRNGIFLGSFFHPRHYAQGEDAFVATLADPAVRASLRAETETTSDWENWYRHIGNDWNNALIVKAVPEENEIYVGMSVQEAADSAGVDAWDLVFDLLQGSSSLWDVRVSPKSMNEEQKFQALRAPFVSIDSDASPVNPASVSSTHPRAFGTFPRVLAKYVRDDGVITLEEGIRKMTSMPANRLRLFNRGRLSPGMAADIVIFDPEKIQDKATFTEPLLYSEGIDFSIVNGVAVIEDGSYTGTEPGHCVQSASK